MCCGLIVTHAGLGNVCDPLRTMLPWIEGLRPTSVDFVSTETHKLLAAYTNSVAGVIDIEPGQKVLDFDFGDGESVKALEPAMPNPTSE